MVCDLFAAKLLRHLYYLHTSKIFLFAPSRNSKRVGANLRKPHPPCHLASILGIILPALSTPRFWWSMPSLLIFLFALEFLPAQWHKGLNVVSEKSPSNYNVEKLWIILLFEADFNGNNKWLGRAVMFNAEAAGMVADKQYGSCKHKLAIAQCLNKLLFYDLVQFQRQPSVLCSYEAKSCYDRIALLVAALCLCQLGVSHQSVFSMVSTIHQMEHHIQTTYGDSSKFGSRKKWGSTIVGIGQGNGKFGPPLVHLYLS